MFSLKAVRGAVTTAFPFIFTTVSAAMLGPSFHFIFLGMRMNNCNSHFIKPKLCIIKGLSKHYLATSPLLFTVCCPYEVWIFTRKSLWKKGRHQLSEQLIDIFATVELPKQFTQKRIYTVRLDQKNLNRTKSCLTYSTGKLFQVFKKKEKTASLRYWILQNRILPFSSPTLYFNDVAGVCQCLSPVELGRYYTLDTMLLKKRNKNRKYNVWLHFWKASNT